MAPNKIVDIVTHDSKTIGFTDQDICVNDNIMYNMDTKEIIERIILAANSLNIVSDGSRTKSIETIIHISNQYGDFDLVTLNDVRGHTPTIRISYDFIIVKIGKSDITLPKGNRFENSIRKETEGRLENEKLCCIIDFDPSKTPKPL
jgi:ribosomal protein S4E